MTEDLGEVIYKEVLRDLCSSMNGKGDSSSRYCLEKDSHLGHSLL